MLFLTCGDSDNIRAWMFRLEFLNSDFRLAGLFPKIWIMGDNVGRTWGDKNASIAS
jgi:hypothetical protein